ncbi:thermonuclease family protein [Bosea sp. 2YAB26]|uniref:thermonuclease family protein n=1 Tax=Bosea sp. 2YAB26 TaxID=3237478 RepID=UPI003F936D48
MKHLVFLLALACSTASLAEPRVVIIDGDTVDIAGERIRILNIDAPETRGARCEDELILGLLAKERLAELLRAGPVAIDRCESSGRCEDRYGRTLARLRTAKGDVGAILIAEGLAQPWKAGGAARAQRIQTWCPR